MEGGVRVGQHWRVVLGLGSLGGCLEGIKENRSNTLEENGPELEENGMEWNGMVLELKETGTGMEEKRTRTGMEENENWNRKEYGKKKKAIDLKRMNLEWKRLDRVAESKQGRQRKKGLVVISTHKKRDCEKVF